MLKLLIICTTFFLLYLGFSVIEELDSRLILTLYDYHVETTFFVSIIFTIILLIVSFIFIKTLIFIINLPVRIQNIINKKDNDNYFQLKAMAEYIMGNEDTALSIAHNNTKLSIKNKEFYYLTLAQVEKETDQKIVYFKKLIELKDFRFFALKNLAMLFFEQGNFQEALDYAIKAYNLEELDGSVLAILVQCYGKLTLWEKFTFVSIKISKLNKAEFFNIKSEIAKYYLIAAKNANENNDIQEAVRYLELSLEIKCISPEILEFYFILNPNIKIVKKIKILKEAFTLFPSLEIVEVFIKFTEMTKDEIFEELTVSLDKKNHLTLIYAIASYLNLSNKFIEVVK